MYCCFLKTPIGELVLAGKASRLETVCFASGLPRQALVEKWMFDDQAFLEERKQLTEYFDGKRELFDFELKLKGTEFQLLVFNELQKVPYGTTCSYSDIAHALGSPKAVRAVGRANGLNPLLIVVPCHRVIGADGKLMGYSGGVQAKAALLRLETRPESQYSILHG